MTPIVNINSKPTVEFVVVTENGILRNPSPIPPLAKEIYVVIDGFIKCSIIQAGKPNYFTRHFSSIKVDGKIQKDYDEYHIEIDDTKKVYSLPKMENS